MVSPVGSGTPASETKNDKLPNGAESDWKVLGKMAAGLLVAATCSDLAMNTGLVLPKRPVPPSTGFSDPVSWKRAEGSHKAVQDILGREDLCEALSHPSAASPAFLDVLDDLKWAVRDEVVIRRDGGFSDALPGQELDPVKWRHQYTKEIFEAIQRYQEMSPSRPKFVGLIFNSEDLKPRDPAIPFDAEMWQERVQKLWNSLHGYRECAGWERSHPNIKYGKKRD